MSPIEAVTSVFRNYVNFSGRATRPEFWWFILFTFVISVVLGIIGTVAPVLQFLEIVFSLAVLLPSLAVQARRLHDMDRSAWWLLLVVPPIFIIGVPILLIMSAFPGTPGPNRYGPDPLRPETGADPHTPGVAGPGPFYAPPQQEGGYSGMSEPAPHPDLPQANQPQPASERQRRYCTQCGTQLQPDARFCTYCGTAI